MQTLIENNLYLVNNSDEYNEALDLVFEKRFGYANPNRDPNRIPDDVELLYPHRIVALIDYPALLLFEDTIAPTVIPVAKVVGSLGEFNLINMKPMVNNYFKALRSKSLTAAPRIVLNSAVIVKLNEDGQPTNEMVRIQFTDTEFVGSVELGKDDRMFVAPKRDVTDLIVKVTHDEKNDRYHAVSCFNHYTFLKAIPELTPYVSPIHWSITIEGSVVVSEDPSKRYGQYWD